MRLTGPGFQATGKIWHLQNRMEYGYQDITVLGEDGYRGTGDNHKKIVAARDGEDQNKY